MAENKQYIMQVQENGSVMISEDVVSAIVAHTVSEVEGVVGLTDKVAKKNWDKGLKVVIGDNNELTIHCNIILKYGQSVVGVAQAAQDAIRSNVESMTGVVVTAVNVNVCGIANQ